ncbi:MAG TPA: site-specific DNA-methyltransferase, partial [Thermoleophilia bacterium]
MQRKPKGRLELTWMGKDSALIPVEDGKYDYAWVDPNDPRAREVKSIEVLQTVGEVDGPTGANENLLIIGDSGDALRSLRTIPEYAAKYLGRVKLVYIDPPFNTSQTFEHYADQLEHSIWLSMMRDRIRDIKPLLADDASVWVHLDDAEVHRMRVLLDEEFGPENFVATVVWQKADSTRNDAKGVSGDHDTI